MSSDDDSSSSDESGNGSDDESDNDDTVDLSPATDTFWSSSWFQTHVANEIQQAMIDYEDEAEMSVATTSATASV